MLHESIQNGPHPRGGNHSTNADTQGIFGTTPHPTAAAAPLPSEIPLVSSPNATKPTKPVPENDAYTVTPNSNYADTVGIESNAAASPRRPAIAAPPHIPHRSTGSNIPRAADNDERRKAEDTYQHTFPSPPHAPTIIATATTSSPPLAPRARTDTSTNTLLPALPTSLPLLVGEPHHPFPLQPSPTSPIPSAHQAAFVSSTPPAAASRAPTPRQQTAVRGARPVPPSPARTRSMNDIIDPSRSTTDSERTFRGLEPPTADEGTVTPPAVIARGPPANVSPDPQIFMSPSIAPHEIGPGSLAPSRTLREKDPTRWSNLEDLIDKTLFLSVTASDAPFIRHFLLTYRKFATPRSVLLGIQRRLRLLETKATADPMFAAFAQIRICSFLNQWTSEFESDFTVQGAAAALNAIVKNLMTRPHTLYHGAALMPFMESLNNINEISRLTAADITWGMAESLPGENESQYVVEGDEEDEDAPVLVDYPPLGMVDTVLPGMNLADTLRSTTSRTLSDAATEPPSSKMNSSSSSSAGPRNRTASLPLNLAQNRARSNTQSSASGGSDVAQQRLVAELVSVSNQLLICTEEEIARELTLIELELFLKIKPRDWLSYAFSTDKRNPEDPVANFWFFANRVADWVASMILCHDKPKMRTKHLVHFVKVARHLRAHNNYSALRSVLAGIGAAAGEGEACHDMLKTNHRDLHKQLQQHNLLLQPQRSHQTYRTALKHTVGACIPAVDVHVSDLLRAHEGNPDIDEEDPGVIHWAKFHMLGKFVDTLVQCQNRCYASDEYKFPSKANVRKLIEQDAIMSPDMQFARSAPIINEDGEIPRVGPGSSPDPPRRESVFRKLFPR